MSQNSEIITRTLTHNIHFEIKLTQGELSWIIKWLTWILKKGSFPSNHTISLTYLKRKLTWVKHSGLPSRYWALGRTVLNKDRFSSVQSLSCDWLFVTPWTAACQASFSITNPQSLPKLMYIELMSIHPSHPLSSISPPVINLSQHQDLFKWVRSSHHSASTSVLPMHALDCSPLGWTVWIPLQTMGLSRVFFNTIDQKHQFFHTQLSLQFNSHIHT